MKNILINLFFFICGILFRYLWIGENYNIVDITIIVIFMTGVATWIFSLFFCILELIKKFWKKG